MTAKYTVKQIMKWKPCYALWRVQKLVGDGLDATELAVLGIPIKDRVWVLIRMLCDIKGKDAAVDFAGNCALRAYYKSIDNYRSLPYAACAEIEYNAAADYSYDNKFAAAASCLGAFYAATVAAYAAYAADSYTINAYDANCDAERQWQIDYLVAAINS